MKDDARQAVFYRKLGENIRECRRRRKLSQETLATLVGLTRTSLTNIEQGRQHPPLHTFCEIAEQLKVDVSELLPASQPTIESIDIKELIKGQVRAKNERTFIETAIGIKPGGSHGDTKKEN